MGGAAVPSVIGAFLGWSSAAFEITGSVDVERPLAAFASDILSSGGSALSAQVTNIYIYIFG
jgi:hypothetical protein